MINATSCKPIQSDVCSLSAPHCVDSRLVAAVQINAGANCHKAANLVTSYYFAVHNFNYHESQLAQQNEEAKAELLGMLQDSEADLRKFLFNCRRSASDVKNKSPKIHEPKHLALH